MFYWTHADKCGDSGHHLAVTPSRFPSLSKIFRKSPCSKRRSQKHVLRREQTTLEKTPFQGGEWSHGRPHYGNTQWKTGASLRERLACAGRGPGLLPSSQRSQGLPQAAPRVAQHSDFSVPPLMFTSQRLSWILSQHVPFRLSTRKRKGWGACTSAENIIHLYTTEAFCIVKKPNYFKNILIAYPLNTHVRAFQYIMYIEIKYCTLYSLCDMTSHMIVPTAILGATPVAQDFTCLSKHRALLWLDHYLCEKYS